MKKLLLVACILLSVLLQAQQNGVIYNIAFRIDEKLVTQMQAQNSNYKFLNLATVEDMPKELSDTIALVSEKAIGEFLNASLTSLMPKEKLFMGVLPEHLMYLPSNTFKKALKKAPAMNFYVDISCHIAAKGGVSVKIGSKKYSKLKPKLSLKIKVMDKDKNVLHNKTAILKDFQTLRSRTYNKTYGIRGLGQNTDRVTSSETIDAEDVLRMYLMGLEEALK